MEMCILNASQSLLCIVVYLKIVSLKCQVLNCSPLIMIQ